MNNLDVSDSITVMEDSKKHTIEIRTHAGRNNCTIDTVEKVLDGKSKLPKGPSVFVIEKENVYQSLLKEVDKWLRKGYHIKVASTSLLFTSKDTINLSTINELRVIENEVVLSGKLVSNANFIAHSFPTQSKHVIVTIDPREGHYLYSMVDTNGASLNIDKITHHLSQWIPERKSRLTLECLLSPENRLCIISIIHFDGKDMSLKIAPQKNDGALPDAVFDLMPTAEKNLLTPAKLKLKEKAISEGEELIFIPIVKISDSHINNGYRINFQKKMLLKVMSVNILEGFATLCALVSGVPVEITKVKVPDTLSLESRCNVIVGYSAIYLGELINVSLVKVLDSDDTVYLPAEMINAMGFVAKPVGVKECSTQSAIF